MRTTCFVAGSLSVLALLGCNGQTPGQTKKAASTTTTAPTTSGSTATPGSSTAPVGSAAPPLVTPPKPPTSTLDLASGTKNPGPANAAPGTARVVALQARLSSTSDVTVTGVSLTATGTSVPATDFPTIELAIDGDGDGAFLASKDQIVATGTFSSTGVATFTQSVVVKANTNVSLLALVTLSANATVGGTLDLAVDAKDVKTGTTNGATVNGSAKGATITIASWTQATNTWKTRAKMPTARTELGVATDANGAIHALGGRAGNAALATHEAYDPKTDRWTTLAPLPTARFQLGTVELGGKIVAIGGTSTGTNALAAVEEFDPAQGTWRALASLPTALRDASCVVYQNEIWVMGGKEGVAPFPSSFVYAPATNTWRTGSAFSVVPHAASVGSGWIVLLEGYSIYWGPGGPTSTLPAPGAFAQTAYVLWDFATHASAVTVGTWTYVVGGFRNGAPVAEVNAVDVSNILGGGNPTGNAAFAIVRANPGVALSRGRIFVIGGESNGVPQDAVEQFAP